MDDAHKSYYFSETSQKWEELQKILLEEQKRICRETARLLVDEEEIKHPGMPVLIPREQKIEKKQIELEQLVKDAEEKIGKLFLRSFNLIRERFDRVATLYELKELDAYLDYYFNVIRNRKPEEMEEILEKSPSFQEAFEIPSSLMLIAYTIGVACYMEKAFEDALGIMSLLAFLNPTVADFWAAQGCACYELGRFEEAAFVYRKALEIEPENFIHRAYLVQSLYCDKKIQEAIDELKELETRVNGSSEKEAWHAFLKDAHEKLEV